MRGESDLDDPECDAPTLYDYDDKPLEEDD
jgi:hypothetical protein